MPAVATVDQPTKTDAETRQRWRQERHQREMQKQAEIIASNDEMKTAEI